MSDGRNRMIALSAALDREIGAGVSDDRKEELLLKFLRDCAEMAKYVPSSEDYEYLVAFFDSWESYYKASFGRSPRVELKLYTESEREEFKWAVESQPLLDIMAEPALSLHDVKAYDINEQVFYLPTVSGIQPPVYELATSRGFTSYSAYAMQFGLIFVSFGHKPEGISMRDTLATILGRSKKSTKIRGNLVEVERYSREFEGAYES